MPLLLFNPALIVREEQGMLVVWNSGAGKPGVTQGYMHGLYKCIAWRASRATMG